jgi:hypothetical protein
MGTLHKGQYRFFLLYFAQFFLELRNLAGRGCREVQYTHFRFNNVFIFENRAVYEIIVYRKYIEQRILVNKNK